MIDFKPVAYVRSLAALLIALALLLPTLATPAAAQTDQRCFPETGQCIAGPIRMYWERNGGLPVFGFPITAQGQELVEGQPLQVQWFQRDRLEIQASGQVTAGRLGVERLEQMGTPWQQGPGGAAGAGCAAFVETGYQVCGTFAQYWRQNGGLERFGLPVTGEFTATLEGQPYTVQYFERRRFELHPEVGPNAVLLGLLGSEVLTNRSLTPMPPPQPTPAPQPPVNVPAPGPGDAGCGYDPGPGVAPDSPVKIVGINDRSETVTLRNVSSEPVNLDGWRMCSIRGPQDHRGIGGTLAPGQELDFTHQGGQIWSNSEDDPGALYNAQGQLVSYWAD